MLITLASFSCSSSRLLPHWSLMLRLYLYRSSSSYACTGISFSGAHTNPDNHMPQKERRNKNINSVQSSTFLSRSTHSHSHACACSHFLPYFLFSSLASWMRACRLRIEITPACSHEAAATPLLYMPLETSLHSPSSISHSHFLSFFIFFSFFLSFFLSFLLASTNRFSHSLS